MRSNIPRAVPLNKEEDILKSAGFKEEDIVRLYEQFVQHCYPSQFMSCSSFKIFTKKIEWKTEETKYLSIFRVFNYMTTQ